MLCSVGTLYHSVPACALTYFKSEDDSSADRKTSKPSGAQNGGGGGEKSSKRKGGVARHTPNLLIIFFLALNMWPNPARGFASIANSGRVSILPSLTRKRNTGTVAPLNERQSSSRNMSAAGGGNTEGDTVNATGEEIGSLPSATGNSKDQKNEPPEAASASKAQKPVKEKKPARAQVRPQKLLTIRSRPSHMR